MRVYLDTNILGIWVFGCIDELSSDVYDLIVGYDTVLLTSSVCMQEFVHLIQIGKFRKRRGEDLRRAATEAVASLSEKGIDMMPVTTEHIQELIELPLYDDHRDPNDRMIIAQAISDKIPLVSSDSKFDRYEDYGLSFIRNER